MCGWRCCASRCAPRRAGGPSPAWASLIPNRSRPSQKGQRGYEASKRIKGRKRHIASDAMGLLLTVVVPSAGIQDRVGTRALLVRLFMHFECLKTIFADGSYSGRLINWALSLLGWNTQVIKRCQQHIFGVLPQTLDCAENLCLAESIEEAEQGL
ncbi:transposase [uncultured Ottowia sp.]|uniref:transposase n=1 Tax=uncultured Ottowia sp. TaxID=543067 RepID=UPI002595211F|nr:transposase [uncultured Ottowia sp.]